MSKYAIRLPINTRAGHRQLVGYDDQSYSHHENGLWESLSPRAFRVFLCLLRRCAMDHNDYLGWPRLGSLETTLEWIAGQAGCRVEEAEQAIDELADGQFIYASGVCRDHHDLGIKILDVEKFLTISEGEI